MEDVARLDEAPRIRGRGFTISPAVDANLRDRIRSLLISRNRQQPPRTPCSSPDYNYLPRSPEDNSSRTSFDRTRTYNFSAAQAIAKLARLEYEERDMGATRFDGPAGQIQEDDADVSPRRPSQPNMEEDRNRRAALVRSRPTSGLDQRAQQDVLGRESFISTTPHRAKSSANKKPNGSRLPRFYLRTVPPATDVNKIARPNPQHVPGSYRSDFYTKKDGSARIGTPVLNDDPDAIGNDVLAVPTYTGLRDEHGHNAIDALYELKDHGHHVAIPSEALRSASKAQVSQATLGPDLGPEKPPEDAAEAPVFIIGSDNEEENMTGAKVNEIINGPKVDAAEHKHRQALELSVQSPKEEPRSVEKAANDYLLATPLLRHEKRPSSACSSVRSLELIPVDTGPGAESAASPLLPKTSTTPSPSEMEPAVAIAELPLTKSPKSSPNRTQKPSPISRAMSMLSEMSTRSGIQASSLRSLQKQMKSGSSNFTSRPQYHRQRTSEQSGHRRPKMMGKKGGYRPLKHEHYRERQSGTDNTNGTIVLRQQQNQGEAFSKVITDLEGLLKEALAIAGHAASRDHSEEIPLSSHPGQKDYDRTVSHESLDCSLSESSFSGGADEEDNYTTWPHLHSVAHKDHAAIHKPASNMLHDSHSQKAQNATPNPDEDQAPSKLEHTHRDFLELPRTSLKIGTPTQLSRLYRPFNPIDPAGFRIPSNVWKMRLERERTPPPPQPPPTVQVPSKEQHAYLQRGHGVSESALTRESVREYVNAHQRPPIEPRISSVRSRKPVPKRENVKSVDVHCSDDDSDCTCVPYVADFKTATLSYHPVYQAVMAGEPSQAPRNGPHPIRPRQDTANSLGDRSMRDPEKHLRKEPAQDKDYSLKDRHHFSIHEPRGFSLSRSHRRSPIARDWSTSRKRYVAIVACITTAFMGLIIGIYAGEVPAMQYALADEHHYVILGNVLFFFGLAITTGLFYPLPLLHGRKPYTLAALAILLPLQFPQALSINSPRTPSVATYRIGLLLPRVFAGIVMGFANINFITTLLDLFGASLQSGNPHQEIVNVNDVRRHGGGMGVWLGIWTFSAIGSIGIGFLIGAGIISGLDVSWGFWITIILNAGVLVLNILTPEVRRSAYRRSMAEVRTGTDVSRRVARGEIKMHLQATGPIWWWEEVIAGHVLAIRMLKQPGFIVLSLYLGWIYGQVVLVIVLLGALLSKYYLFHPQYVGLAVAIIPLGALLAIPFQKASLFSRSRHHRQRTDSMTFEKRVTWTSHLVRRSIFMIVLPFADLAYTLASGGHPTHFMVPIMFAGLIGFLSNLAIAECHGIIMENYDTSDLQPGMTGRPRRVLPEEIRKKRTNFSCFPRVTAAFAIAQTCGFIIAAGVTGWGGVVERHVGAQTATAVMAGVLLVLTLLLIGVLWRYKVVQIIPSDRFGTNILSGPEDEWKPIIIGNPSGTTRRMSILELGYLSRWSEIRRRNRLAPER